MAPPWSGRRVRSRRVRPRRGRGRRRSASVRACTRGVHRAVGDGRDEQRVLDKIDAVVSDEFRDPPDFAKPLTGAKPWQSLRVGDYRAMYDSTEKAE